MATVFLSHALQDRVVAAAVATALHAAGVSTWSPALLKAGEDLPATIEQKLAEADCVVALWSRAAADSAGVTREVALAINAWALDRLVLARIDAVSLPPGLRDIDAIDLGSDGGDTRQRGIAELVRRVVARCLVKMFGRQPIEGGLSSRIRASTSVQRGCSI